MATWRGSSVWDREVVPTLHGPVYSVPVTVALLIRIAIALEQERRFRMPNKTEQYLLDQQREEQVVRAATVNHGAWL